MTTKKSLLFLGMLLAGSFASPDTRSADQIIAGIPENCDQNDMGNVFDLLENANLLCAQWEGDTCVACSTDSYFNAKGICVQRDPLCKTFDDKNAVCIDCYDGYSLSEGKCVVNKDENWITRNPLCSSWKGIQCVKCSKRSYFSNGICTMVNPDCQSYSQVNGACTSCYDGYKLQNGACNKANLDQLTKANPLCAQWSKSGTCLECAPQSYRNSQGICIQVDPNCSSFSQVNGDCLSCYKGYALKQGQCVLSQQQDLALSNPYCASWNNRVCEKCSPRTYMDANGRCTAVSPQCQTFNQKNGDCLSCYPGYKLDQGKCLQVQDDYSSLVQSNPLCGQWGSGKCVKCSPRSYMNANGQCIAVDAYCNTYSDQTGACKTCYTGYRLIGGKCLTITQILAAQQGQGSTTQPQGTPYNDPLCNTWASPYACKKCSTGCYFSADNKCAAYDANCKKFNELLKKCEQCPAEYEAVEDKCLKVENPSWDVTKCVAWKRGACSECAKGLQLDSTGACVCAKVQ